MGSPSLDGQAVSCMSKRQMHPSVCVFATFISIVCVMSVPIFAASDAFVEESPLEVDPFHGLEHLVHRSERNSKSQISRVTKTLRALEKKKVKVAKNYKDAVAAIRNKEQTSARKEKKALLHALSVEEAPRQGRKNLVVVYSKRPRKVSAIRTKKLTAQKKPTDKAAKEADKKVAAATRHVQ